MSFNIINVVSNVSKVNMGVWKAALVGSATLLQNGVSSFLCVCDNSPADTEALSPPGISTVFLSTGKICSENLIKWISQKSLSPENSIVITHGSWLMPTKLGRLLSDRGYCWIYVPQGMLEPWSMNQSRLKKKLYLLLFEKPLVKKADVIRAVSKSEKSNLRSLLNRDSDLIENGVAVPPYARKPDTHPLQYVFMARLHFKKGIVPLVKQWNIVMTNINAKLIIAGTDEGELQKIKPYLKGNIEYIGPVYGVEKTTLLRNSHYYFLPSYSEGFPSSVLEAMSYGMIPLISGGCNFSEVFESDLGYKVEPDDESIHQRLILLKNKEFDHDKSMKNHAFVEKYYSESAIGKKLFSLYTSLLAKRNQV